MKQTGVERSEIVKAWNYNMANELHSVSKQEFVDNLETKAGYKDFVAILRTFSS